MHRFVQLWLRVALTLGFALGLASTAEAVCNQTSASTADIDMWNIHGCDRAFYLWQYRAYNVGSDNWGDRGWNDACNVNKEFPKLWSAAYLVTYGLADNGAQSFHGTTDYRQLAEGADSNFKDAVYYAPTDRTDIFGGFQYHWPGNDEIDLSCLLFNASVANANPASRAGDFMHEGWHGWLTEGGWNNGSCGGHRCGTPGNCTAKDACDFFYFHGIGAYAFGALYQTNGTASRFHSPNQVQVEFLCDVANQPKGWVPASVRSAAALDANTRANQRFINGPGYHCGDPRPW